MKGLPVYSGRLFANALAVVTSLLLLSACTTTGTYVSSQYAGWAEEEPDQSARIEYQIFLVGDAGGASGNGEHPALKFLGQQLSRTDTNAVAVFLGDNIYCCGLSEPESSRRGRDEQRLGAQLATLDDFKGRAVFAPGNHDWDNAGPGGLAAVKRQEDYVERRLGYNAFLPDGGTPGPVEIKLTDSLVLVVIDTQWWLHAYDKRSGNAGASDAYKLEDFTRRLEGILQRNVDATVVVAGHHPVESRGEHAGYLPLKYHVFPLRKINKALWIPLPIIGSAYPLASRYYFGSRQDLGHATYRRMRKALKRAFSTHSNLVYASGHEHNLQYFNSGTGQHYIVSGAGSRPHPVGKGRGVGFAYGGGGHTVPTVFRSGAVWMEMWAPVEQGVAGERLFRTKIKGPDR